MNIDFPLILVCLVAISGFIWLVDKLFFEKSRKEAGRKEPWWVDYSRSFFPIFLAVLLIRSFIIQPFRVPTGSLEPSVQPGDFIAVNQFAYGLRLPVLNTKIKSIGEPKRGDVVVFRYPADPSVDFVKRVIGLPGDHIVYRNRVLYINGEEMPQHYLRDGDGFDPPNFTANVNIYLEDLQTRKHLIQLNPSRFYATNYDLIVPPKHYFVMGDNRDDSEDSRYWGFLPEENLIGKAFLVWMSWDPKKHWFDFSRIGTRL